MCRQTNVISNHVVFQKRFNLYWLSVLGISGRAVRSPNVTHSWPRDTGNSGSSTDNSMMTNHSSLFKLVCESPKRGVNMRDIFGSTESKSSPSPLSVAISTRPNKVILVPQPKFKVLWELLVSFSWYFQGWCLFVIQISYCWCTKWIQNTM